MAHSQVSPGFLQQGHNGLNPNQILLQHSHNGLTENLITTLQQQVIKNNNDAEDDGQFAHNGNTVAQEAEEGAADIPNTQEQDDEALSMSVELAAVNQAILSLTGTQPINITKPEETANKQVIIKQELPTTMVVQQEELQET
jgi:hypothetical protein